MKTGEYVDFLVETLKDLVKKAERVLKNQSIIIRGFNCHRCPIKICDYNGNGEDESFRRIAMQGEEFNFDIEQLLRNMYPTVNEATDMVIEELESDGDAETNLRRN